MEFNMKLNKGDVTAKFEASKYYADVNVTISDSAKNYEVSWREIDKLVNTLAEQVKGKGYDRIIGVARGGCVPAVMLSNRLDISYEQIVWQTRDGKNQEVQKLREMRDAGGKTLIVDDLIDSGLTVTQLKSIAPHFDVAVLYAKTDTKLVDYVAKPMYDDARWLAFPWE
jgi:xanthine phosphoribosyltransferase